MWRTIKILKSIRGFNTFDLLTTMSLTAAVVTIVSHIVQGNLVSRNLARAQIEVRDLSKNIVGTELLAMNTRPTNGNRAIASSSTDGGSQINGGWEGTLNSDDPWGQAYLYKIVRNAYGQPTHMVVWSKGPNGQSETPDNSFVTQGDGTVEAKFQGDDLGYVRSLR